MPGSIAASATCPNHAGLGLVSTTSPSGSATASALASPSIAAANSAIGAPTSTACHTGNSFAATARESSSDRGAGDSTSATTSSASFISADVTLVV